MKKILLASLVIFGLNQTQAQINYCDSAQQMIYTTGNYNVYDIALGAGGNSLNNQGYWMAPIYVWTTTPNPITGGVDTWEDSCLMNACTHTVYNEYDEDTITTCISYHLEYYQNGPDTIECCIDHYWNGQVWVSSTGAIAANEDLIGQWYSKDQGEYVTFTSDSILIHTLENENDCYEFMSMSYEIQSDTSFIAIQEFQGMSFEMEVVFALNNDNLTIYIDEEGDIEQYNYVSTNYDSSKFNLCSDFYTWICNNKSSCVEVAEGSGEFANQEECEWQCFSGEVTYECWEGDCYEAGDFGSYQSYEACVDVCELVDTTSVTYNCIVGSCLESFFGQGQYNSLEECEEECGNNNEDPTYDCILGACYENILVNSIGAYSSLEECEQDCNNPSDIEEEEIGMQLIPNPFSESMLILLDEIINHYKVYDISGKLVKYEKMNSKQTQIKRDNLPSGMYFLEVYSNDTVFRQKFIIQ